MSERQPRGQKCISSRLYEGLTSFAELERRIEAPELRKDRGDAFEVFVEAYLATQLTAQAETVWPSGSN
tara:strand:+ start:116 stop:322 length:207 start_codon:yes stop_codon:yes gene_type:complete